MSAGTQTAVPRRGTLRAARPRAGFAAALLHRLSGIALALFLPMHFIALGTALQGADRLESFLGLTHNGFVRTAEWGLVSALALHMVLGLRVLAIEWFVDRGADGARRLRLRGGGPRGGAPVPARRRLTQPLERRPAWTSTSPKSKRCARTSTSAR